VSLLKKYTPGVSSNGAQQTAIDTTAAEQPEYEVEKIIGKRLGKHEQMEYLVLWKDYPESEATWERYDIVKELKALEDFEQLTTPPTASDIRTQVWRKWSKNHVQQYVESLTPPSELDVTTDDLLRIIKKHKINGERLAEITKEIWVNMGLTHILADWLMTQLNLLFDGSSGYRV
jgi:hypothetical protein